MFIGITDLSCFVLLVYLLFEIGSGYIIQATIEFAVWSGLTLNLLPSCLSLPRVGITGMVYHICSVKVFEIRLSVRNSYQSESRNRYFHFVKTGQRH